MGGRCGKGQPRTGRSLPVVRPAIPGAPPVHERRDAAEHRRRILATARELFAARGVDGVSMQEIARAASVGQGTLYRRYEHKGELCGALMDESVRRFQADILADLAGGGPALAQLDRFLVRHVAFNEENAPLLGAMADAAFGPRRGSIHAGPMYGWLRDTVRALLRRAVADGEIPPADVEYLADAVLAPLAIDLYLYQRHERGFTPERIVAGVRRLVLDGLRGDAGT
ncbi:MAG: hypothetical protein AVDCRST_MAG88-3346 [uncultured Thermomicrobiales bacterium]|uniref:HTH tetR-type domain-containing protein n=1 Tax=uncultured Thermomicrobiales bacterium TaxID=1645740 RepID=A0A6J4VNE3_9BACT|nr:MAG: hypothetical protein AVDCRST_MAG88-3346 [uncultured Thermomicrobiales bacterium]